MIMARFSTIEKHLSQMPVLQMLENMGYEVRWISEQEQKSEDNNNGN